MNLQDVEQATAHWNWSDYWNFPKSITWYGKEYPVEVVERVDHEEGNWSTNLLIVFKVTIDGESRYFKKTGYEVSHEYMAHWDGPLTEVHPRLVTRTEWV